MRVITGSLLVLMERGVNYGGRGTDLFSALSQSATQQSAQNQSAPAGESRTTLGITPIRTLFYSRAVAGALSRTADLLRSGFLSCALRRGVVSFSGGSDPSKSSVEATLFRFAGSRFGR